MLALVRGQGPAAFRSLRAHGGRGRDAVFIDELEREDRAEDLKLFCL